MQFELFIAIFLPIIIGIIVYMIKSEKLRNILVIACTALVMLSSVLIVHHGNFSLEMGQLGSLPWNSIIEVLDLALGLFILYISISLKNKNLILLSALQVLPMFIFENFTGANLEINKVIYADLL